MLGPDTKTVSVVMTKTEYETIKSLAEADERSMSLYIKRLIDEFMQDPNCMDLKGRYKKIKRSEEEKLRVKVNLPADLKEEFFTTAESKGTKGATLIRLLIQERAGKDLPHYLVKVN